MPARLYAIGCTVNIPSMVTLFGDGIPAWNLADRVTGIPTLTWIGSANGTVVSIAATEGALNDVVHSANVNNFAVQCNSIAGIAFYWGSVWNSEANVYAEECVIAAFQTRVIPRLRDHTDVRGDIILNLVGRQILSTNGPILDIGGNGTSLAFGGDTALCIFTLDFVIGPTNGIQVGCSDHNVFLQVATAPIGATDGPCMWFKASNSSVDVARFNRVVSLACGQHRYVYFEGTENGLSFPSANNQIAFSQMFIVPVTGTGATYLWCNDAGICSSQGNTNLALGDSFGITRDALLELWSLSPKPSLFLSSGASNQAVWTNGDFTRQWQQNINNAAGNPGDMRLGSPTNSSASLYITNPLSNTIPHVVASLSCQEKCKGDATTESTRICSASSNNLKLANCIDDEWSIAVLADGSLRIINTNGSNTAASMNGLFSFSNLLAALNSLQVTGYVRSSTYISAGSLSPPTNTNAGDISGTRLFDSNNRAITTLIAGAGILISGTAPTLTVTNTAAAATNPGTLSGSSYNTAACTGGATAPSTTITASAGPMYSVTVTMGDGVCTTGTIQTFSVSTGCTTTVMCTVTPSGNGGVTSFTTYVVGQTTTTFNLRTETAFLANAVLTWTLSCGCY